MSSEKNICHEEKRMFDRDPVTGRLIPLPLGNIEGSFGKRKRLQCPTLDELKPLKDLDLDFGSGKKTVTNSVRKGLFSPQSYDKSKYPPRFSMRTSQTNIKKISVVKNAVGSPLINLEEAEKELYKYKSVSAYPFRPRTNRTNSSTFSTTVAPVMEVEEDILISASSNSDETMEFTSLERTCNGMEEPNNNLDSQKNNVILEIKKMLNAEKTAFAQFQAEHLSIMSKFAESLELEKKSFDEFKKVHENTVLFLVFTIDSGREIQDRRHSGRLRKINTPVKMISSPQDERRNNLLRSTLKKQLDSKYDQQSPRTRKALDLYNEMRINNNQILVTPKMDRRAFVSTSKSQVKNSLSMILQKQCLLLQDTPRV